MKGTESATNSDGKGERETDTTSGKKKLNKNFIYNEFTLIYPSYTLTEIGKKCQSIDMHTCNTYMICHQQAKYHLSDSIMFNISVSSVVMHVTASTRDMKTTSGMAVYTTSGKRNICKNFINNTIR